MYNTRKRKVIDIEPGIKYYQSGGDGVIEEILEHRDIKIGGKISRHYKFFMKFFYGDGRLTRIQQVSGSDTQYLFPLSECIVDGDNLIMMTKFQSILGMSSTGFAEMRKRLKDKAILIRIKREWYANPFIFGYGNDIEGKVVKLFREKTAMIYGITEL